MALELRSPLCTFENSTKRNQISFDPDSFLELLKGLLPPRVLCGLACKPDQISKEISFISYETGFG